MILVFSVMGRVLRCSVDEERVMRFSGENTNNKWISFKKMVELTHGDVRSADMTEKIVMCLPSLGDVEWYLVDEFRKNGIVFLRREA